MLNKTIKIIFGELQRISNLEIKYTLTPNLALAQWIKNVNKSSEIKGNILITAFRNNTWIEWAAYFAFVSRQMGFRTTILYKDSEIKKLYKGIAYFNFWENLKKVSFINFVNIEVLQYDKDLYNKYYSNNLKSSISALAYDFHLESVDITDNKDIYNNDLEFLRVESAKNGARVNKFLSLNKFHQFVCYSGIISDTSMILQGALDANHDVVCVEGWSWRPGHMIYNFNAPALEYNIKGWLNYIGTWDLEKEKEISEYFKFLEGNKLNNNWLSNFYPVQLANIKDLIPTDITNFVQGNEKVFLLAANVIGDSSLLNRETFFKSHKEFIKETVDYFKTRSDLKLIIRIHPAEEWVKSKVKIKLGEYSKKLVGNYSNILVIDSYIKLNTFALMPFVHAGLVWVTSAGVDMVVRGKRVITSAIPKYYGLGIVEEPKTKDEYFNLIDLISKTEDLPTTDQLQKAKEYLYIVFKGFSFEAQGRTYRADSCKLGYMPCQEEHDRFYRIILKLESAPDKSTNFSKS